MQFYNLHRRKIKKFKIIRINDIRNGDIIYFRYKGKSSAGLRISLVLNVWPLAGARSQRYIHSIDLNSLAPQYLKRLINFIQDPQTSVDPETKVRTLSLPLVRGAIRAFYKSKLSKIPKVMDSYRTFRLDRVTALQLADYDYGADVLPPDEKKEVEEQDED